MNFNLDKSKKYFSLNILLVIIGFFLILLSYHQITQRGTHGNGVTDTSTGWQLYRENAAYLPLDEAMYESVRYNNFAIIKKSLTKEIIDSGNLIFYLKDASVTVSFDNVSIYNFGNIDQKSFDSYLGSYGTNWHVVKLPKYAKAGDEVKITFLPNNPKSLRSLPYIYTAKGHDFSLYLMKKNMFSLIHLMFLLGFAFMSIVFYQLYSKRYLLNPRIRDFGLFILTLVMWFSAENLWVKLIFFDQRELLGIISFYGRSMLIIPYIYIFLHIEGYTYEKELQLLVCVSWLNIVLRTLIYLGMGIDLNHFGAASFIFRLISHFYLGFFATAYYIKTKDREITNFIHFGWIYFVFFIADAILEVISRERYAYLMLELPIMLGVVLLIIDNIRLAMKSYKESIEVAHYKKLSVTDAMTGLGNKNLFLTKLKELETLDNVAVIALDINDLKQVNDTKGHLSGDRIIVASAELINSVFDDSFDKFRTGGDEFFVLSKNKGESELEELLWRFNDIAHKYNETTDLKVNIASGVAVFNPQRDVTIEDVMNRADENMYIRKITMKI